MKTVSAAIIVAFSLLGKLLSNKLVLFLLIGGLILLAVFKPFGNEKQEAEVPTYSESIPIKQLAPTLIITPTRLYYVYEYDMRDTVPVLKKYYIYNSSSGEWEKRTKIAFPLDYTEYKIVTR